ncbi:MAG: excinuclease ABC subunit UvrC [Eubacteriales bacterium]|nr:excinuclease ABC subunit UvrC [Eubacteriales bacterium]
MFDIQEELKKLPDNPGVYIMKDKYDKIIYVGKALVLKNRVKSYFASQNNHSAKTRALVSNIAKFEYIVTDSEHEALVLECNLIKKHRPKYNIMLMDDKNYPYIKITMAEEFPRILKARKVDKDGSKYYGPYTTGLAVKETIELIKKIFPVKTCNRVLPRDAGKARPCLNYHIGRCLAPCKGDVTPEEYRDVIKDINDFLNGKHENIIGRLQAKMGEAAERLDFEAAAVYRNRISGLKHISEKQKVLSIGQEDRDVIAHYKEGPDVCMQIFIIRNGKLIGSNHFILEKLSDDEDKELFTSFVKQFYDERDNLPGEIIIEKEIEDKELIGEWLSGKRGLKVNLAVPKRGIKKELVDMCIRNARLALHNYLISRIGKGFDDNSLEELKTLLGLEAAPHRIEAYDISNTGVSEITASMVVYIDGKAEKTEYRHYRIKSLKEQNDYAAIQEVLYRRFRKIADACKDEKANESRSGIEHGNDNDTDNDNIDRNGNCLPDLVLLDGGKGHVSSARVVLCELGLTVNAYGMVKDDAHHTRALVTDREEIKISDKPDVFRLISGIQDEAHRFALKYNKQLRSKRYSHSELDDIEGIGESRKKALLKHFKSLKKIKEASAEEIAQVDGISIKTAEAVYEHFRK